MCYPKPGPRCANHLRVQITQAEKTIAKWEVYKAQGISDPLLDVEARNTLRQIEILRFDYAGTQTGQKHLKERIAAEKSPAKRKVLEDLAEFSKVAYDEKKKEYDESVRKAEEAKARKEAERKNAARKRAALKVLADDSKKSVTAKKGKVVVPAKKPPVRVDPVSYSSYSYGGKGGGKY